MNKLPNTVNEVSIKQFNELREIDNDTSTFMKQVLIVSILADIDPTDKELEDMDIKELVNILNKLLFLTKTPEDKIYQDINDFKLIELNNLTLGEFIDLDYYISENPLLNLSKIAAILYRHYKFDEYKNVILEEYDNINLTNRSAYFEEISIGHTFGLLNYFLTFKKLIYDNYNNIFNPIIPEEDLDEEDYDDPDTAKEIEKEKLQAKFSWEIILHNLAKGDVTKFDPILKLPVIFIMNQLSFKKSFSLE